MHKRKDDASAASKEKENMSHYKGGARARAPCDAINWGTIRHVSAWRARQRERERERDRKQCLCGGESREFTRESEGGLGFLVQNY